MKPLILVASITDYSGKSEVSLTEKNTLNTAYSNAIIKAGGLPIVLPYTQNPEIISQALEMSDGLLLPGGPDISPRLYGRQPMPNLGYINLEMDKFHLLVIDLARDMGVPILGICRGAQILNVAFGGTLIQHIPQNGEYFQHDQKMRPCFSSHSIRIEPDSLMFRLFGNAAEVNSIHHQAVEEPGEGFKITSHSPDGIAESIENENHPFIVGVQWHPEEMTSTNAGEASAPETRMASLFESFIEASKNYSDQR